jgi:hypothetical protein
MRHASHDQDRPSRFEALNSGLWSALGHLLALIALGLMSGMVREESRGIDLLAQVSDGQMDLADGIEILPVEAAAGSVEIELDGASTAAGPVEMFETAFETMPGAGPSETPLDFARRSSGLLGKGVGDGGDDLGRDGEGDSRFFGLGGKGRSFVYVLDCSGSMNDEGRFIRAREELLRSIEHLTSDQSYYVIFYNDGTYPMDADGAVPATPRQIDKTRTWVDRVFPGGGTRPKQALLLALSLEPDAIYFLSDGIFDPSTLEVIRAESRASSLRIPIHTIAIGSREGQSQMRTLSRITGGRYHYVR